MGYINIANSVRDWAVSKIGCNYSQAKRTQEGIFDCSSLIARAYSAQGKAWKYGGRVPISCNEVYDDDFELIWPASYDLIGKKLGGSSVIAKAKQPGDIQFLNTMSTNRANKITHVTMVASASKIVHAAGFIMVEETDMGYNQPAYDSATRQYNVHWTWCLRSSVETKSGDDP